MTNIQLKVMGATAAATADGKITSGMVGLPVSIECDASWAGLSRTAFFRAGDLVRKRTGVSDNTTVPWEILRNHSKRLEIGLQGKNENGDIVITTVWATVGTISEGASGDILAAPLPNKEPFQGGASIDDGIVSEEYTWSSEKISKELSEKAKIDDSKIGDDAWSSKNTADKLCPDINESGAIVACEPLSGYPLTVQAEDGAKVYRSGKNLLKPWTGNRVATGMTFKGNGDGSVTFYGTPTAQWSASCFITVPQEILNGGKTYSCTPASGSDYTISFRYKDADGNYCKTDKDATRNRIRWNDSWSNLEIMIYCPNIQAYNETVWLQLELGETATDYEPYVREEFAPGEPIPVLDGVNTLWADSGEVTVSGKADPVAVSRRQDERIKALEASLTALLEG